jgi:hypothetical protein
MLEVPSNQFDLKNTLDVIRDICLDGLDRERNVTEQRMLGYLDVDEDAKTYMTDHGLLRIIDYVNLVFKENRIDPKHFETVILSIISAAKVCEEKGYYNFDSEDKIKELFYWAKVGI